MPIIPLFRKKDPKFKVILSYLMSLSLGFGLHIKWDHVSETKKTQKEKPNQTPPPLQITNLSGHPQMFGAHLACVRPCHTKHVLIMENLKTFKYREERKQATTTKRCFTLPPGNNHSSHFDPEFPFLLCASLNNIIKTDFTIGSFIVWLIRLAKMTVSTFLSLCNSGCNCVTWRKPSAISLCWPGTHCIAQAGHELSGVLLPLPPECAPCLTEWFDFLTRISVPT